MDYPPFCSTRTNQPGHVTALLALVLLSAPAIGAGTPELIKDVNSMERATDSLCGPPTVLDNSAFFCARNDELWQTDGTEAGTQPLYRPNGQIFPGSNNLVTAGSWLYFGDLWRTDGSPQNTVQLKDSEGRTFEPELMTDVDGELFFFEFNRDLSFLHELWKTDGTDAGTVQVKLFDPRLNPNDAAAVNDELFFTNYEHQLWKSDGTLAGTVLLKDLAGRNYNQDHNNLTNVNGVLFFSLEDEAGYYDLWKSDGTTAGTVLVRDNITERYMKPGNFVNVDGRLFFTAESNYSDTIVWQSDGTTAGTQQVVTLPGYRIARATSLDGLYILADPQGLWRIDGTPTGTQQLARDLQLYFEPLVVHNDGRIYFGADNGSGLGYELWATDGTLAGTRLVSNIAYQDRSSTPGYFGSLPTGVIFQANRGSNFGGPALWVSDGTDAGTEQIRDISEFTYGAYPSASTLVGNQVYYLANMTRVPTTNQQWQVWKTDGSEAGTALVLDLIEAVTYNASESYGGEYAGLAGVDGRLYISGNDGSGWGLWRTDGTPSGAEHLVDVVAKTQQRPLRNLTAFDERLFFFAETSDGDGLRRLAPDQTVAALLVNGLSNPASMTVLPDRLVFASAADELWQSDGTAAGTRRIRSLGTGEDTVIDLIEPFGERFVFRAQWNFNDYGSPRNSALWISDGTSTGTYALTNYYSPDTVVTDSAIYYSDYASLWVTDGSVGDATRLLTADEVLNLTAVGNTVYFSADGQALWKTRGTPASTVQVVGGVYITGMLELNDELYFAAFDAAPGGGYYINTGALRKSDGTAAGTMVVAEGIAFIDGVDSPRHDIFYGRNANLPQQLWQTDGTEAGTRQLSNFQAYSNFGPFYYEPQTELYANDTLFFSVDDGYHGPEIWGANFGAATGGGGFIGDFTWWDQDGDGVQDAGEPGLPNVTVSLQDCAGDVIATTQSGTDGYYAFDDLPTGNYGLQFTLPNGYAFSPAKAIADYSLDSNPDPDTGLVACRTLAQDQRRRGLDAGFIQQASGRMGDRVWFDTDADGVQDTGEPGSPGVVVNLETCSGAVLQSTTTDNQGNYLFDGLAPADYRVRFALPAGYAFSPPKTSGDYRTDSNADPATGLTSCRALAEDQNRLALDAGLTAAP